MFSYPTPCNYESRLIKLVFGGPIAVAPCISALEANFGGKKRRYASNIYNTENKLYILKLNGFE